MRTYIYYSTIVGLFSGALIFKVGVNIRLFYLILLLNLFLLLYIQTPRRTPRWIGYFILYLSLSGVIGILRGTDTASQFVKEFLGISCNALFYYLFFRMCRGDFLRAFTTYARLGYFVCLLGFPILVIESLQAGRFIRLQSITLEPAAFCELLLPAYFWYAAKFVSQREHGREVVVFSIAILLAGSSLGYMSVAFGAFLLPLRRKAWLAIVSILVAGFLALTYAVSLDFRMRVDDTLQALSGSNVSGANLSSFALVSNVFVTENVLETHPLLGNGLGSHVVSYRRLIGDVPGLDSVSNEWIGSNADEASSLTLRVLSEQGLLGMCLLLWFIVKFHAGWKGPNAAIGNALLTCFFLKLIRGGIYFGPEQFFFVFIYILNYRQAERAKRTPGEDSWVLRDRVSEPRLEDIQRAITS